MNTKYHKTQGNEPLAPATSSKFSRPYWKPILENFIASSKQKFHIVNLEITIPVFNEALELIANKAAKGGTILFVGTKRTTGKIVSQQAERCGQPYVIHRWLGGMLTNYKTIRVSIERLLELELDRDSGAFDRLNKKEVLIRTRHLEKLHRAVGGIKNMRGLPDALFVIDTDYDRIAIKEANNLGIPVIGIVSPDDDHHGIDVAIPGNNDSTYAIKLYATAVADVINANHIQDNVTELEDQEIELLKTLSEDLKIANARAEKAIVGAQRELELTLEFLKSRKKDMQKD